MKFEIGKRYTFTEKTIIEYKDSDHKDIITRRPLTLESKTDHKNGRFKLSFVEISKFFYSKEGKYSFFEEWKEDRFIQGEMEL